MGTTLSQAAEHTGKSKSVLSKAIARGSLSANKNEDGSYDIDYAELDRWVKNVYKERKKKPIRRTEENLEKTIENRILQEQLKAAIEEKNIWKRQAEDLRQEREDWKRQAQTLLLSPPTKGNFWQRITGKGQI